MNTVIITDKMLHGGMTSGKIDGKTVFIAGALPQEEVSIPHCPVADDAVNDFLNSEKMQGKVKVFGSSKIMNSDKGYIFSRVIEKYEAKPQMLRGKKIKTGGKRKIYEGTTIQEDEEVRILVQDKELAFNVLGFFQSNVEMLEKTAQLISKHLPKGLKVLDMYGGAGTLSALCAEKAEHVTLVEHNRDAVVYAEKNLVSITRRQVI